MSAKKKIALVLLGSATLILLALAIGYFKMGAEADAELNAEIKRSKAAGTWLASISDLVVPVPKERNAAPLYQQAFQLVEKIKEPSGSWFDTPEGMAKIKKFVEDISPAMKIAKEATKFSDCQFDHHYDSPAELYPEMLTLKTLSQGFVVRAELESREGSPDKSIDDLVTAGKIAHHIGQAPILIASLVQISRDTAILAELEKLLTSWPKIASRASLILDAMGPLPPVLDAFRGEMANVRKLLSQPLDWNYFGTTQNFEQSRLVLLSKLPGIRSKWQTRAVRYNRLFLERIKSDPRVSNLMHVSKEMANQLDQSKEVDDKGLQSIAPVFIGTFDALERDIATRRMARQAIAIIASGKTPSKPPLQGDLSQDPYDNQPLGYTKTKKGFRLFAIGPSGTSFGGVRRSQQSSAYQSDLVFEYPYIAPVFKTPPVWTGSAYRPPLNSGSKAKPMRIKSGVSAD